MVNEALALLRRASTPEGLLASPNAIDNYARVWARDSMMTGIAGGLLGKDAAVSAAWRASIDTLLEHQSPLGIIPSNVSVGQNATTRVSYGSLAGRVDATSWWIIGACLYARSEGGKSKDKYYNGVERALNTLQYWEFNGRGLVYVPLGGNWADEYVVQGYTLYDQLLRLWALRLSSDLWQRDDWHRQALDLHALLCANYLTGADFDNPLIYHPTAYRALGNTTLPYWVCALAPNGYDTRWDMAANALAMLLGLTDDSLATHTVDFLDDMAVQYGHWMLPAFSPVIFENTADWALLSQNYSYRFKNHPYHFHNGGAWPVMMGWLGLAFHLNGHTALCKNLHDALLHALYEEKPEPFSFYEYWNPRTLEPGGASQLCFSASGAILLSICQNDPHLSAIKSVLLP